MKKVIIIDASLAAKWLLPDEEDFTAETIKKSFANREIAIAVPFFIFYEVNNILRSAVLSKRITLKDSLNLYKGFLSLNFNVYSSEELFQNILQIALELKISSYDAVYVALAQSLQIPLYTADAKLVRKANHKLVKSLEDYVL